MKRLLLVLVLAISAFTLALAQSEDFQSIVTEGSLPVTFENDENNPWVVVDGEAVSFNYGAHKKGETSSLKIKTNHDKETLLTFVNSVDEHHTMIYLDNKFYNELAYNSLSSISKKVFRIKIPEGQHTVEIKDFCNGEFYDESFSFSGIGSLHLKEPFTVNNSQEGLLAENVILSGAESLSTVEDLKVTGVINEEDWNTIYKQMTGLKYLDLSEATCSFDNMNYNLGISE